MEASEAYAEQRWDADFLAVLKFSAAPATPPQNRWTDWNQESPRKTKRKDRKGKGKGKGKTEGVKKKGKDKGGKDSGKVCNFASGVKKTFVWIGNK